MKTSTKIIIGGGLVATTGLAIYAVKKRKVGKPVFEVQDYILDNKEDAEAVLETLVEMAEKYDQVSVCDYYDALGESSSFVTQKYGWKVKAIRRAKIRKTKQGWTILFPRVEEL